MASAVYILDAKGRVLINFNYRADADVSIPDKFMNYIQTHEKIQPFPVFQVDDWFFMYIDRYGMYFMCCTKRNADAAALLTFLGEFGRVLEDYLGSLTADAIVDNFSLVYELLDEVMDYGYPQNLDSATLSQYILREKTGEVPKEVPISATGVVSWRREGVSYSTNEIFVDLIEEVNMIVSKTGAVLHNEVVGKLNISTYLSGSPEVRIGLNDKIAFGEKGTRRTDVSRRIFELEDVKFHPCVRLSEYERDRAITFIPPDGDFNLMTYRLSASIKPIIHIEAQLVRVKHSRFEVNVQARSQYREQTVAQNVQILVPVPPDVDSPKAQCSAGRMRYSPNDAALVWTIRQFPGRKQYTLRARFGLPSVEGEAEVRRPVQLRFEIPLFTVSGLRIQYLKVHEKSGYTATPWIRYVTQNGTCEFRAQVRS